MRELEVRFAGASAKPRLVGSLAERDGRIYFEYSGSWLGTGLSLSPFRIPFAGGLFEHKDRAFGPLPGLFADSLPDGWGLLLMDRHFRSVGRESATLGPLDRLAWLGNRTMGALTYHPPTGQAPTADAAFDLEALARHAWEVLEGRSGEVLPQLIRAGGSPGGAWPKVLVGFDPNRDRMVSGESDLPEGFTPWLVKFAARAEAAEAGPMEYSYSLMARAAGLEMPETRLFETAGGGRHFGVKRFDRAGGKRIHIHSFGNLIHADFRIPSCDYSDLLKLTALLTRSHPEVLKAFRQMVFNVFAHNRDDHAKNFAFLLNEETGDWSLTPAFDLSFSHGPGGEHTTTLAGEGKAPGLTQILALAQARGISRQEALLTVDQVRAAVARWREFAGAAELVQRSTAAIAKQLHA